MSFFHRADRFLRLVDVVVWLATLAQATGFQWEAKKIKKDTYAQVSLDGKAKGQNFVHITIFEAGSGTLISWQIPALINVPPVVAPNGHIDNQNDDSTNKTPYTLIQATKGAKHNRDLEKLVNRVPILTGWRQETEENLYASLKQAGIRDFKPVHMLKPTLREKRGPQILEIQGYRPTKDGGAELLMELDFGGALPDRGRWVRFTAKSIRGHLSSPTIVDSDPRYPMPPNVIEWALKAYEKWISDLLEKTEDPYQTAVDVDAWTTVLAKVTKSAWRYTVQRNDANKFWGFFTTPQANVSITIHKKDGKVEVSTNLDAYGLPNAYVLEKIPIAQLVTPRSFVNSIQNQRTKKMFEDLLFSHKWVLPSERKNVHRWQQETAEPIFGKEACPPPTETLARMVDANSWLRELGKITGLNWKVQRHNIDEQSIVFDLYAMRGDGLDMTLHFFDPNKIGVTIFWSIPTIHESNAKYEAKITAVVKPAALRTPYTLLAVLQGNAKKDLADLLNAAPKGLRWAAVNNVIQRIDDLSTKLAALARIPRDLWITPQDVKANLELYWSPAQNALYPKMMGHGAATSTKNIAEDIHWGFLFKAANSFFHSPWRQKKARDFQKFAVNVMGDVAKTLAHNIALDIYNSASGSMYWGMVFTTSDLENKIRLLRRPPQPDMRRAGITQVQMIAVADWLQEYVNDLKTWEKKLDQYVAQKVFPVLRKLIPQAEQGLPPDQWRV